jgi:putative ABC transport system permease protein
MSYALTTLWHERNRFLPGVLAVAFSALLIVMQCGLLLGLFSLTSLPIDRAQADIWVGHPVVLSVDLGRPIPERWLARVAAQPEVVRAETYLLSFLMLDKPDGRSEMVTVIGARLDEGALGAVRELTPELRARLTERGSIVVDESDLGRLGLSGVGDAAEVFGHRVRVVGLVKGLKSLAAPYLFCSLETARLLFTKGMQGDQTVYVLARCRNPEEAPAVVKRLRRYPNMSAFTKQEFSTRTRLHWLTATKSGIAVGVTAVLGLVIGAVITSQTLYAATAASLREYAVLRALGIPRWRIAAAVLAQSFWVGGVGLGLALPAALGLAHAAEALGTRVLLPSWLLGSTAGVTMAMALLSGLAALRSLRLLEPIELLH